MEKKQNIKQKKCEFVCVFLLSFYSSLADLNNYKFGNCNRIN